MPVNIEDLPEVCEHKAAIIPVGPEQWQCSACDEPFVPVSIAIQRETAQAQYYDGQIDFAVKVASDSAVRAIQRLTGLQIDGDEPPTEGEPADLKPTQPAPDVSGMIQHPKPFLGMSEDEAAALNMEQP